LTNKYEIKIYNHERTLNVNVVEVPGHKSLSYISAAGAENIVISKAVAM